MSETEVFKFNVGAVLRNDHTGTFLTIEDRNITNYGNCGYTVRREDCAWTDWEGEYTLLKNWSIISDPVSVETATKRIKIVKDIKEMPDDEFFFFLGVWEQVKVGLKEKIAAVMEEEE